MCASPPFSVCVWWDGGGVGEEGLNLLPNFQKRVA